MYTRNCEIKPGMDFPAEMHRVVVGVEYNGAVFNGFQKQASTSNTVQAYLESALSKIANEPITGVCAGRTDAGVHAWEQVFHFDTLAQRPDKAWVQGVNCKLPDTIRVRWAKTVESSFHARFSASARTYRYVIYRGDVKPACFSSFVTWISYTLDIERMHEAAQSLVGEHDFSAFRSSQCQANSPVRRVEYVEVKSSGRFIVMEIKANAFLHHMVRNIAGVMLEVGRKAKPVQWSQDILAGRDRTKSAATAHPWGLYFVRAHYDNCYGLPQGHYGPLFLETAPIS